MRSLGFYILVKPIEDESKSSSGLLLNERARYAHGEVISIGDNVAGLSVGDRIAFDLAAGHEIRVDDVIYKNLKFADVVLIFD